MTGGEKPKLRILLVGTLTVRVSGTSVNLRPLVRWLGERPDVALTFVNSEQTGRGGIASIRRLASVCWRVFIEAGRADLVTFHMNEPEKGLPIWFLTRLRRKPFLLRWFGGVDYRGHGSWLRRACAKFMLRRADVNLFQTRRLVRHSEEDGSRCSVWFSNSRVPPDDAVAPPPAACRRFMFAGHVKPEKGVFELIAAGEALPEEASVDVYGPFFPGCAASDFEGLRRVQYRGVLKPEDVIDAMQAHDAVVLPTYFPGEGYPGVIIEAYFAGRPVICTDWLDLSEIVDEECGLLVPPRDAEALRAAMQRLVDDPDLYQALAAGAAARGEFFVAERWAAYFLEVCRHLHRNDIPALRNATP